MPLTVAWIADYPIEWMEDPPPSVRGLPRQHPATWMPVLLAELERNTDLRIHVLVLRKNIAADFQFERRGVVFHVLKVRGGLRAPSLFWTDTLVLRRALRRIRPDLVHAWGNERGGGLIASRLGCPYLVTIQGLLTWYREVVPVTLYDKMLAVVEQISLPRARLATTESKFAVDYLQRKYPRLTVCQAEHAPNWAFHRIERAPQTKPVRFITGSLAYRKGSDLLLRAMSALVPELDFELVVIGGRDQTMLDSASVSSLPELERRFQFKSNLQPAEVARELSAATIMVLPTRADTSPNAVKEAVVAGVPVVASAVGGIPDYVVPGQNGLLFPSGDLEGCLQALRQAVRHPLFGRGVIEAAALDKSRAYLSPARMAENFLTAYRRTLELWGQPS